MLFKKKTPEPPKGRDVARREIYDAIERNGLTARSAASLLEGMAQGYRMQIATTTGMNLVPETTIVAPKPKALDALASLIAGKAP